MSLVIPLAVTAVVLVVAAVAVVLAAQRRNARTLAEELRRATADQNRAALDALAAMHRQGMESHALLGGRHLEGKKELIDQELVAMRAEIQRVQALVRDLERDRTEQFGELASQLREAGFRTQELTETTQSLRQALSSTKARGQWGERMAEDVLRLAGFIENVQYRKQKALDGGGGVPDYTFLLPQDLCLHMDVKFPLDNYLRFLESESEIDRERYRKEFMKDVRSRLKDLARRDYVDVGSGTVDCVLLFIPNEQVYAFIQEHDRDILDEALRNKVVFCSPLTLFAVLAVIRQAVDNFRLEQTSKEILTLLLGVEKQWDKFVDQMDKVGRNLRTLSNAYEDLEGTRRRQLDRQFDRINGVRRQTELAAVEDDGDCDGPVALEA
jgi:DNA recombination protein RmuC